MTKSERGLSRLHVADQNHPIDLTISRSNIGFAGIIPAGSGYVVGYVILFQVVHGITRKVDIGNSVVSRISTKGSLHPHRRQIV